MTAQLPDVSQSEHAPHLTPLDWVGMQGIDLPITLVEAEASHRVHARVDCQVNLPNAHIKGIHMSRLYRLLDGLTTDELTPGQLEVTLRAMLDSHADCGSSRARIRLVFDLLVRRPALVSQGLSGWKAYPVALEATLNEGQMTTQAEVKVDYSSTCPCSAALSRQLLEQAFREDFGNTSAQAPETIARWLRQHGTLATPHSQRSRAQIAIDLRPSEKTLGLITLIDRTEAALGTPVQTAVKRADEQAFARLNGQNLLFVEDAARRIEAALTPHHRHVTVHVRHMESLHPHDAVAFIRGGG